MELRPSNLAGGRKPEGETRRDRVTTCGGRPRSRAAELYELGAAHGHDAFELTLDRARRHAEVLGYLGAAAIARVQRGNLPLAFGEPVDHRTSDSPSSA